MTRDASKNTENESLMALAGITLTDDERLIKVVRIHDAIYWKGVLLFIVGLFLLTGFARSLGFFLMFVATIMIGIAHLTQRYLVLAATTKRIFIRSGIFYADMIEMRYSQIESIELGITPIGQIFNYGSVIITGTGQRRIVVPFVPEAIKFRAMANEILINK